MPSLVNPSMVPVVSTSSTVHMCCLPSLASVRHGDVVSYVCFASTDYYIKHVPGFIEKSEKLKAKGTEDLLLISVDDPFVIKARKKLYQRPKMDSFYVKLVVISVSLCQ
ncbi:hypothetical protein L1987_20406 [Smallanthus sonchifolius]|uniref:Uncharacterized protein n=1 Tax=Smallanthus sonchifolius TaxID=185202 RepID=A0ACB9IS71_9ASTR|nr:hypothetical protein L1987_20406 [Smallanthus sonchifolius]